MKRRTLLATAAAAALAGCTAGGSGSDSNANANANANAEFDGWKLFTYDVPGEYQYEFIGADDAALLSLTVDDGTVDAWISDGRERIYEEAHTGTPDEIEAELAETPIGAYLEELWYREEITSVAPADLEDGAEWTDETDDGELSFEVKGPGSWGKNSDIVTYSLHAKWEDGTRDHVVKFAPNERLVIDATYYENDQIDTKVYIYQLYD